MPDKKLHNIAIIGSGIAGMAAAARLAYRGHKVTVYEKNNYPGGKLGLLLQDGYTFDTGPSLFTQPYVLANLFGDCGRELTDYLTYQPLDINTQYFYEDGTVLTAYRDHSLLQREIETKLGISAAPMMKVLKHAAEAYNNIGTVFLDEPIHDWKTWASRRIPKALTYLRLPYLLQSMHAYHTANLKHPKLVQLFDRFATYNGSDPYKAPAMLSMIAHLEMNEGAYYPQGGMLSVSNALFHLCKDVGVSFEFNQQVEKIATVNNMVTGVVANGIMHKHTIVVSNSDVYFTYERLLRDDMAVRLKQQERSSSAVIFYWGIRRQFPQLQLHNIFFSNDYKAEFQNLFDTKTIYNDPTVYINITSKMEQAHAPAGCENWFVLINTPAANNMSSADIERIKQNTIKKINRILNTDIGPYIETEAVLTPAMIEARTGSYMGALYGTASNNPMAAFRRHPNQSKKYKGLYFAGGTVHPGGGIPLCLRSAKLAADAIAHQRS